MKKIYLIISLAVILAQSLNICYAGSWGVFSVTSPSVQSSNITFSDISRTSMTVTFNKGDGDARAVFIKTAKFSDTPLTDANNYISNTNYGSGDLVDRGAYCIYSDTGNTVNVLGLTKYKLYYFRAFEFNNTSSPMYLQTTNATNPATRWTLRKDNFNENGSSSDEIFAKIYPNPTSDILNIDLELIEKLQS